MEVENEKMTAVPVPVADPEEVQGISAKMRSLREAGYKGKTSHLLAKIYQVSPRGIEYAAQIQREAPDLFERIKAGSLKTGKAVKILHRRKRAARTVLAWVKENYASDDEDIRDLVPPGSVLHENCSIEWGGGNGK